MELALAKVKGKNLCKKLKGGQRDHLRNLSHSKQEQADGAKQAALEILQDAVDKKLYGRPPDFWSSCHVDPDPYIYSSILAKELLENMIEKMKHVKFLEDTGPESDTFAYVYPNDQSCTVYLCHCFWSANDQLSEDSKPGILIHEVSHFLGTEDVTYDFMWVELHENMAKLLGRIVKEKAEEEDIEEEDEEEKRKKIIEWDASKHQINANCIEYEFEMILNHRETYSEAHRKYPCCGEEKINSVCLARDIGHYVNETVTRNAV